MVMVRPEGRTPFTVGDKCRPKSTELTNAINAAVNALRLERLNWNVETFMMWLTTFVNKQLAGAQCVGFISDGDMARDWKEMFSQWNGNTAHQSVLSVCSCYLGCG